MSTDFKAMAKQVLARAKRKGAKQADVFIEHGRNAAVRVRDGAIEDLTQATGKGVGVRVLVKDRLGFAWTSDFSKSSLEASVDRAVQLAEAAAPNKLNALPEKKTLGAPSDVGPLFDPQVANLDPEWKIKAAIELEKAGKAVDPRIRTFESVGAGESVAEVYLATSEGMFGGYEGTYVYLYGEAVAAQDEQLQVSGWFDYQRFLNELESPESVGREAAQRAVRMLGAKKVKSQKVPVVMDPTIAAQFVGTIAAAANGDMVYKRSSFLAPKLNTKLASDTVTIVDDGLLAKGLGTAPFDGEGVATRRTPIIEKGVLSSFLYDTFTARKAKAKTTGNASRGYRSLPGIGTNNLYLEKGTRDARDIIKEVPNGLYVTKMIGHGINLVNGEYSRGANGLWIENGELTRPVQEVTVAGNLLSMLEGLDAVGKDLTFRGSTGAPTLRFKELTVSGE